MMGTSYRDVDSSTDDDSPLIALSLSHLVAIEKRAIKVKHNLV
jgi:hypothetical protein